MKKLTVYLMALIFFALLNFNSCSNSTDYIGGKGKGTKSEIKVVSWNLETFFDGVFDGNEYYEFSNSSSGWNKEKYYIRLERLVQVAKACDADVMVFEELEKKEQLQDIFNLLCNGFNSSKHYNYGAFSKDEGSSIGCGVLSRYPLEDIRVHGLDIRSEKQKQPSMRSLMKVKVIVNEKPLQIFVNHWKSKSGGEAESEKWRNYQERILSQAFNEAQQNNISCIACGDFNRDIEEFEIINKNKKEGNSNIKLKGEENVEVYSPWITESGSLVEPGSYYYKSRWERIDHFFAGANTFISDFKVENNREWSSLEGYPLRYILRFGSGYSDHFPVSCSVKW